MSKVQPSPNVCPIKYLTTSEVVLLAGAQHLRESADPLVHTTFNISYVIIGYGEDDRLKQKGSACLAGKYQYIVKSVVFNSHQ